MKRPVILPTHTPALFRTAVDHAVELLRAGDVVALPTETVYGLAANALSKEAVAQIFRIKGRPANNPIIVHVASTEMARECVAAWPALAGRLAKAFWPGPLTLVLPRSAVLPDIVTAGRDTVGVRWPSHPFIQEVIRRCGFPLAAPSANPSNQVSPTTAEHVKRALGDKIRLIVDGGPCQVGIESTVLDLTVVPPAILRPGMIHAESLQAVTEKLARAGECPRGTALRSPGLLPKHYSPKAKLEVWSWHTDAELQRRISERGLSNQEIHIIAHHQIPLGLPAATISVVPHDAQAFARAIYAELHRCDDAGAKLIIVEALPDEPEWQAIRDRLARAASEGTSH